MSEFAGSNRFHLPQPLINTVALPREGWVTLLLHLLTSSTVDLRHWYRSSDKGGNELSSPLNHDYTY